MDAEVKKNLCIYVSCMHFDGDVGGIGDAADFVEAM